jgi:F0F1-type ATP synthase beta subunit
VPVVLSPKFQVIVYGSVPPVVTAVKVTCMLTSGVAGRKVKLVDNGGVGRTVTVLELVAVWEGEDESVAVSVTVKDWELVKV